MNEDLCTSGSLLLTYITDLDRLSAFAADRAVVPMTVLKARSQ
jgi:hypothetical protein